MHIGVVLLILGTIAFVGGVPFFGMALAILSALTLIDFDDDDFDDLAGV